MPNRAWIWIVAASAVAHLWCLGSVFYLDDHEAILFHPHVRNLRFWEAGTNAWTILWYGLQSRVFGMSPVGFHLVNWMLHTAIALVLYRSGRDYLERDFGGMGGRVAWFGGMLFAVHPLASEIPNYARTQDIAWVTLFAMLGAWFAFRALRGNGWRWVAGSALCIVGATVSKGPGFMHGLMMAGVVGLSAMDRDHWRWLRKRAWMVAVAGVSCVAALWWSGLPQQAASWKEPRVVGHAYTLCRVFWEFVARSVVPVKLSADHHIEETLVPPGTFFGIADKVALWSAAGLAAVVLIGLLLFFRPRTRVLGSCVLLYSGAIVMRFLYFIPEFMPEYRIYPGLPWFCLGAAICFGWIWRRIPRPVVPALAGVVLLGFAGISAKRSWLFHDVRTLMGDVLRQYPAQLRAVWVMQREDSDAGRWQTVIARHQREVPRIREEFVRRLQRLAPRRELPTGHFSLAEVGCWGLYARAISRQTSASAGLREIHQLESYMRAMRIEEKSNPLHWMFFRHSKALVLEDAGNFAAAAAALEANQMNTSECKADLARIRSKLATSSANTKP